MVTVNCACSCPSCACVATTVMRYGVPLEITFTDTFVLNLPSSLAVTTSRPTCTPRIHVTTTTTRQPGAVVPLTWIGLPTVAPASGAAPARCIWTGARGREG